MPLNTTRRGATQARTPGGLKRARGSGILQAPPEYQVLSELETNQVGTPRLVLRREFDEAEMEYYRHTSTAGDMYYVRINGHLSKHAAHSSLQLADHAECRILATRRSRPSRYSGPLLTSIVLSMFIVLAGALMVTWKVLILGVPLAICGLLVYSRPHGPSQYEPEPTPAVGVEFPTAGSQEPELTVQEYEIAEIRHIQQEFAPTLSLEEVAKIVRAVVDAIDWFVNRHIVDDHLSYDLNFDSLDSVELLLELEDELQVSIPDEKWSQVGTLGDVFRLAFKLSLER